MARIMADSRGLKNPQISQMTLMKKEKIRVDPL